MTQFKDKKIDMKELMNEICKEVKGLKQEVFLTVWEAFRKFTFQQLELDRTIVILDTFYLQMMKDNQYKIIRLMPTSTLLAQFSLKYRSDDNDLANIGSLVSVTQGNLYKNIEFKDRESLEITKQNAYFIYSFCFKYIKNIIKKYKTVSLQLDFLGSILIYQRTFIHEPELKNANGEKVKVKQLIEKESIQNFSDLKRQSLLSRSKLNLLERAKNNLVGSSSFSSLRLHDQSSSQTSQQLRRKLSPQYSNEMVQKRPFFHEMLDSNKSQNVRITNDLLGAGIDPLTYDYNLSKLVENSEGLFYYKFQKPQKAKARLPGLIDKFSRTIGAQLTGAKVSTSSSIRIGSNYNPSAKNYYIDLSMKQIMRVPQQITIKLQQKTKILPATEDEQYAFVIHEQEIENEELQSKVELRQKTFERYQEYCIKQIPNDCIAPLSRDTLKNIVDKIKENVKQLGKVLGKEIFDKLLNEVNRFYYIAGKKGIVDYILKDESQKNRTGIALIFKPAHDWGIIKQSQQFPQIKKQNTFRKKLMIQSQFLTYPELILEIVKHNEILDKLQPFNLDIQKNIRPMNILYHLKKHSNNFTETMSFLNEKWVKGAVEIITRNKNWKKQNIKNFKTFMNNVHTLMSNKLKDLVYRTLEVLSKVNEMFDYQNPPVHKKPVLYLHLGEENRKIIFMDDLNNIYKKQAKEVHRTLLKSLSQILSPQCYIKEGEERFLWSIDPNDDYLIKFNQFTEQVIERNYEEIEKIKEEMKKFEKIYRYKDELLLWTKTSFQSKELDSKLRELKALQTQINEIPFYQKTLIAVVDCHDLKKKLNYEIKIMRYYLFECIENLVKKVDETITERIKNLSEQTSKDIKTTTDYVELSKLINFIKQKELVEIQHMIKENQKLLMKLFTIESCFVSQDLLKEIYNMQKSLLKLQDRVAWNQDRIAKERSQLQKTLKERISNFQALAVSQLREINLRIDSFEVRKLYTQYLVYLTDFKQKSEKNMKQMLILNHQEDDLKWASTTFSSAIELENLIAPNFELWRLVEFYDQNVREWKHLELSNFDIEKTESRIAEIDTGISKIINKLKNFSSLKIAHQLQNDVKQVINKQLPIIKIFSHPGLKDRHWHLFSKKLTIPGYDLKEIVYGRIKILYDYEKNLKVLSSISNQAAKEFEIENEKTQMSAYWFSLNNEVRIDSLDEQMVFLQDDFLNIQIAMVEDHLMRTLLIKNSPFSKALNQMLTDWQNYLLTAKSILVGFKNAQQGFLTIKDIFKIDDISKYLPIENAEFESIENIWKTVIKKVLEQPKISQLFKSQKITEILEQITKKSIHIKSSLPIYLHSKRVQFPRFFFTSDSDLIEIFSFLSKGNQKQALTRMAYQCYNGLESIQKYDKGYRLKTSIDYMDVIVEKQSSSKKQKIRVIEDAPSVLAQSKQKIKAEIKYLLGIQNLNESQGGMTKYTVTSLLAAQHITFSQRLNQLKVELSNNSEKAWKQLQKLSKQMTEFIGSKQRQVNMNEVRKTDCVVFRKLCYRQILQFLLRKNNGVIDSFQLEAVPKLCYQDKDQNFLVLKFSYRSIDYDYEYAGCDVLSFLPLGPLSTSFMSQMLQNVISGDITLLNSNDAKIATRLLSQLAGKFYKEVDFIGYLSTNSNGIHEILAGLVSSDVWINLNMDHNALLKLAADNLSLISQIIEQKKMKILQHSDYILIKENQIPIYKSNAVFFYISTEISCQLPDRLFSSCRNLTIPKYQNFQYPLMQFLLSNQIFFDWETISTIKIVIEVLKNLHPEVNLSIALILRELNSLLMSVQQSESPKIKKIVLCKMLQKVFNDDLQEKSIRTFLKLPTKELQGNLQLKKQTLSSTSSEPLLGFPLYFKQKLEKLEIQSKFNDIVIVYGSYGYKTTLIQSYLEKFNFSKEECQQITINTCFLSFENTLNVPAVSILIDKALKNYEKMIKENNSQRINPVIFDGLINDERLGIILKSISCYKKKKPSNSLISLIECPTLDSLSPKSITSIGKVFVNNYQQSDRTIFQQWADKLPLKSEQITYLKSLGLYLQGILDFTIKNKHILSNMNRDYPTRHTMIKSFLKLLEIYLMNLNTKEVESLPEFDPENYIINSFIFTSYWALGVGFAVDDSKKALEIYLKETFGTQYDIPHWIEDNLLNEENQWVSWQNLKEEFAPQKQSDAPLCSLWVPTIENTKFYTIIIKLLEKDLPLFIFGSQSGKSTLIREISNFEISYTTFIVDCNKRTDVFRVGKLIRDRVVYGDEKKHLILVDDLHLPARVKETRINELILQIIKTSSIPTFSQFGPINQKLKKSNMLLSANLNQQSCLTNDPSLGSLITRFQPLNMKRIDQKQMQYIFKPYLNYFFNHHEFQNQLLRLEGTIMLILIRIFDSQKFQRISGRQLAIDVNDMRKIVDSICRINPQHFKDKFEILSYLIYETNCLLSAKIQLSSLDVDRKHSVSEMQAYAHFKKTLETKHTKFCNPEKNPKQFQNLLSTYIYRDVAFYDSTVQVDKNYMKNRMKNQLKIKNVDPSFVLTSSIANQIQKILHFLQAPSSHMIFVSPKRTGGRSLIKVISQLKSVNYIELGTTYQVEQFLQEVMKILKSGGKVDECICCLPNDKQKQESFLGVVNSLVSSSQFYECLNQIELEQIIKSYNSEKKVLKKDIKKSEIIKKIKEKLNSLFHFVICIEKQQLNDIADLYPNMLRDSFIYMHEQWTEETMMEIFTGVCDTDKDEIKKITKAFQIVYEALNNVKGEQNSREQSKKSYDFNIISLMEIHSVFSSYFTKLQQTDSQSMNLWARKIAANEAKLDQLMSEKLKFQSANKNRLQDIQELKKMIEEKNWQVTAKKAEFKKIDEDYNLVKDKLLAEKTKFYMDSDELAAKMNQEIDKQCQMLKDQKLNLEECSEKGLLRSGVKRYESMYGMERLGVSELREFLQFMRKQGFQFLIETENVQLLQQQLQQSTQPLQRAFLIIITNLWPLITAHHTKHLEFNALSHKHTEQEELYFKSQSHIRSIEDEMEQIKEEIDELSEKHSKLIEAHEEIITKITHLESLLEILRRVKSMVENKSMKDISPGNENQEQVVSSQQYFSLKILFTVCLRQSLSNTESKHFKAIKQGLSAAGYELSQKSIAQALPSEQRISIEYCLDDNSFQSILNYLVVELSPIYCSIVDPQNEIETYLKSWSQKPINYFETENIEELKSLVMAPGYVLILNPKTELIHQLRQILTYTRDKSINSQFSGQIGIFNFHEDAKIIFLYSSRQQIDQRITKSSNWICEINHSPYSSKIIQNFLCRLASTRDTEHLASLFIQKQKQLQSLGQRMHTLVLRMKKDNLESQQIESRIGEVNSMKIGIQKDLRNFKSELKQIFNPKPEFYKHVQLITSLYNAYQIRLGDLLLLIKDIYKFKDNHFHRTLEQLSNIVQYLIKKKVKRSEQKVQKVQVQEKKKSLHLAAKEKKKTYVLIEKKVPLEEMKIMYMSQMAKINQSLLSQFANLLSKQNCILKTEEPKILRKCLLTCSMRDNLPLIERKISEINSITFMPNLWILTQVKTVYDWQILTPLIKSIKDKKLSIRLLIFTSLDIRIPSTVRNIKQFTLTSVLSFLVKIICESQELFSLQRAIQLYHELFIEKNELNRYEKLSILEHELQSLTKIPEIRFK